MDAAHTEHCGHRYLAAKKSVDDRALNRGVMDRLQVELDSAGATQDRRLRVLEIGAGIGTMAARLAEWGVLRRAEYHLVDVDAALLAEGRAWLRSWAGGRGLTATDAGQALEIRGPDLELDLHFQATELGVLLDRPPPGPAADLIIANAFLDLVDVPKVLPPLFALAPAGVYLFTINFDGETIFLPEHPADDQLMAAYHRCMDERVRFGRPAGEARAGRRLFGHLRTAGASILAAGSSDWVVHPAPHGAAGYPADEAFFLHTILDFVAGALGTRADVDARALADWLSQRRAQIDGGQLVYLAHQLDFLGRCPANIPARR